MAGNTAGSRRVLVGADAGTGRTVAGPFGQDHVRPCAGCVAGYGRVDRACHCQHRTACVEASLAGVSARAIAVPGALFAALCLITGSIWGRPTWGTWWVWDGRLTSMLILFFLYLGYIALANASSEKGSVSRTAAVFGIIGAVNIPIINRSVVWWESQHQKASITLGGSSIDSAYLWPLFASALGFTLIFGAVVLMRMRAQLAEIRIEARMRRMAED